MLGFGFTELLFISLLILLLFGPRELPKLARFVARLIYEMKNIFHRLEKEWDLSSQHKSSSKNSLKDSQSEFLNNSNNKNKECKKFDESK